MRYWIMAAVCLGLAGCAEKKQEVNVEPKPVNLVRPDCYTVVLFDDFPIKEPAEDVPVEYRKFLGQWKQGAWNGEWCHDLRVTEVTKDGQVKLLEMHAPYDPWGEPATAFQRTARINEQGELVFRYGIESVRYTVEGMKMVAKRTGVHGEMLAHLRHSDYAPIPVPRSIAVAQGVAAGDFDVAMAASQEEPTPGDADVASALDQGVAEPGAFDTAPAGDPGAVTAVIAQPVVTGASVKVEGPAVGDVPAAEVTISDPADPAKDAQWLSAVTPPAKPKQN